MKISERNTPILKYLKWDKPLSLNKHFTKNFDFPCVQNCDVKCANAYMAVLSIIERWPLFHQMLVDGNIDVVSKEFWSSLNEFHMSGSSLKTDLQMSKGDKGMIIIPYQGITMVYICHDNFNIKSIDSCAETLEVLFFNDNDTIIADINNPNSPFDFVTLDDGLRNGIDKQTWGNNVYWCILSYLAFKKYAPIEKNVIGSNTRTNIPHNNERILNETDVKLNYIDCTWFTEIIKKGDFKVRGHFRLQPCKNEKREWTKKLIYINEFMKHGYHRQAGITKLQNN